MVMLKRNEFPTLTDERAAAGHREAARRGHQDHAVAAARRQVTQQNERFIILMCYSSVSMFILM